MNALIKLLTQSKKERELLSFYDNKDDVSEYYVGYVQMLFEDSVVISSFDQESSADGYVLIRLADLYKIEQDTAYLNKISHSAREEPGNCLKESDTTDNEGIEYLIHLFRDNREVISIKLIYEDYVTGILSDYDGEYLTIENYTPMGTSNGISLIKYENIQSIAFARKEERTIRKLLEGSDKNTL